MYTHDLHRVHLTLYTYACSIPLHHYKIIVDAGSKKLEGSFPSGMTKQRQTISMSKSALWCGISIVLQVERRYSYSQRNPSTLWRVHDRDEPEFCPCETVDWVIESAKGLALPCLATAFCYAIESLEYFSTNEKKSHNYFLVIRSIFFSNSHRVKVFCQSMIFPSEIRNGADVNESAKKKLICDQLENDLSSSLTFNVSCAKWQTILHRVLQALGSVAPY